MSLFSVFDPVSWLGVGFNWFGLVVVVFIFPVSFFVCSNGLESVWSSMVYVLGSLFSEVSFPNYKGLMVISIVLFLFIMVMNVFGLFSFVFSVTGHVVVTLSLGVVVWMTGMLMGWIMNFSQSSAHLVPEGSPFVLAPFMVFIELISQIIRPVTLSVRLAANMMAGHLIVGLISTISLLSFSCFWMSVFMQSMVLVLEWAVCFIQAFVFSVLVMLYSLDYY